MEKELDGFWTWDDLSDTEQIFYVLKAQNKELDAEFFGSDKHNIERFER